MKQSLKVVNSSYWLLIFSNADLNYSSIGIKETIIPNKWIGHMQYVARNAQHMVNGLICCAMIGSCFRVYCVVLWLCNGWYYPHPLGLHKYMWRNPEGHGWINPLYILWTDNANNERQRTKLSLYFMRYTVDISCLYKNYWSEDEW